MPGTGNDTTKTTTTEGGGATSLSTIATVIAIVVLVVYFIAIFLVWQKAPSAPDAEWLRLTDLRGGLEALAFAAAGALFGTTVQRQATKQAEKNADQERARADEKEKQAEGGLKLAGAIRGAQAGLPSGAVAMGNGGTDDRLAQLAEIAREYGL